MKLSELIQAAKTLRPNDWEEIDIELGQSIVGGYDPIEIDSVALDSDVRYSFVLGSSKLEDHLKELLRYEQ